jgi:uncharacterized protein (DUF2236 family)
MEFVRASIEKQVHRLVGFGSGEVDLDRPLGDHGLFGSRSAAWRVHSDFNAMMIGGVAALLLQMLHPRVLAGVWDHSNFRSDMLGRLRRTAQFISGTTYGSTEQALMLIRRVKEIHGHVHGQLPDGTPYSANDPDLLAWVHVTEVTCFLQAHLRYRNPSFSSRDQDRYLAETAVIAHRLGAGPVPRTRAEVAEYIKATRPDLRADERTREVARALLSPRSAEPGVRLFQYLTMQAAIDLLPGWAARMHGHATSIPARPLIRTSARSMGRILRWALRDGSARRAQRRVGAASA